MSSAHVDVAITLNLQYIWCSSHGDGGEGDSDSDGGVVGIHDHKSQIDKHWIGFGISDQPKGKIRLEIFDQVLKNQGILKI